MKRAGESCTSSTQCSLGCRASPEVVQDPRIACYPNGFNGALRTADPLRSWARRYRRDGSYAKAANSATDAGEWPSPVV